MKRISTHILDTTTGKPAQNVPVRLEYWQSGEWKTLTLASTDQDGRCAQLLPADAMSAGTYRLVFDTRAYFDALKITALYPRVEITFQVRDGEEHFHIPLLLSANGYTTYRGS